MFTDSKTTESEVLSHVEPDPKRELVFCDHSIFKQVSHLNAIIARSRSATKMNARTKGELNQVSSPVRAEKNFPKCRPICSRGSRKNDVTVSATAIVGDTCATM